MTPSSDDLMTRLRFADSYTRGAALVALSRANHPRLPELLGEEWSCCDHYPPGIATALLKLQRDPALRARTMTQAEQDYLAALPEVVTIWRGCYESSRSGFSWTTERHVAERFPFLLRYRRPGQPLLLKGEVARDNILFVKLDRGEYEVVVLPTRVRPVRQLELDQPQEVAA